MWCHSFIVVSVTMFCRSGLFFHDQVESMCDLLAEHSATIKQVIRLNLKLPFFSYYPDALSGNNAAIAACTELDISVC